MLHAKKSAVACDFQAFSDRLLASQVHPHPVSLVAVVLRLCEGRTGQKVARAGAVPRTHFGSVLAQLLAHVLALALNQEDAIALMDMLLGFFPLYASLRKFLVSPLRKQSAVACVIDGSILLTDGL
jgi:hypothetical protein